MNATQEQHQENVSVDDIEATLAMEWANLAVQIEGVTGEPPLRTHILTLVIIASGPEEARQAHELIHQLHPSCPSRAILIQIDPEPTPLTARVWAHCELAQEAVDHSYDVIEVNLCDENAEAAPNIISRHKLTDVPVVVYWWGSVDISSNLFSRISGAADRVVLDSSSFDQPFQALNDYEAYLASAADNRTGSDLAWRRLKIWRELVAQSFDSEPTVRQYSAIRNAEISFDPGFKAEALLMASWLTSSLEWQPESVEFSGPTTRLNAVSPGGDYCCVSLIEVAGSGVGLRLLRLVAHSGSETVRVTIRHESGQRSTVSIESTGTKRLDRTVQHAEPSRSTLVGEELLLAGREQVFEQSLTVAATFARFCMEQETTRHD